MKNVFYTYSGMQLSPIRARDGSGAVTSTHSKTGCYIRGGNQTCLIYTSIRPSPFKARRTLFDTLRRPRGHGAKSCTRLPIIVGDTRIQPNGRTDHYSRCWSSGGGAA
jgi:hypothetical protein